MGADAGRMSGPGVCLGSIMGTVGITGTGSLDGWFERRIGGFGVFSVFAASKKECWVKAGAGLVVNFAREKGKTAIGGSLAFSKSTGLTGGA